MEKSANLERWVKEKYLVLYNIFRDRPFTLKDAEDALRESGVDPGNVKLLMAELLRAGLAKASKYAIDERYTQYQLIPISVTTANREEVLRLAKSAADLIRTSVDYIVIPLFIFYKAISDIYIAKVNEYIKQGLSTEEAYLLVNHEYMKLYDEESKELLAWHEVTKSEDRILEMANAIKDIVRINSIGQTGDSNEALEKVASLVDKVGLTNLQRDSDKIHILTQLIDLFNKFDFSQVTYDVIGDTYQWVLRYFAPQKNKEGEVYTPLEVVRLIVRLLDIEDNTKILDPAVGSGAMLIEAYRYVKATKLGGSEPHIMLYGQEYNEVTAALAEMNLMLNNVVNHRIYIGNSLINPRFEEADYVLANPPWNQDGYGEKVLSSDPRLRKIYHYGYPPDNTADWAWVQLMLYHARKKVGVVLDQGALFRGDKEESIREGIIKDDLLEAVVLLPEKLFYNTQAPGVILIFNKEKPQERRRKVLFVNASNEYIRHPEVKRLNMLSDANIEKIVNAYREFKDIPGFAKVVTIDEIERNDYNLNVTLYVTPQTETEEINLEKELQELLEVNRQAEETMTKALQYIQQVIQANRQG